jgi:hypothetical protein
MAAAVKPGGWLCIEEGDLGAAAAVDTNYPGALEWTAQTRSICDRQRDAGVMDLFFGRRVRSLLERTGFEKVGSDGVTNICRVEHRAVMSKGNLWLWLRHGLVAGWGSRAP